MKYSVSSEFNPKITPGSRKDPVDQREMVKWLVGCHVAIANKKETNVTTNYIAGVLVFSVGPARGRRI